MGPSGDLESPMTIMSPVAATWTQLPALHCCATRHDRSPRLGGKEDCIIAPCFHSLPAHYPSGLLRLVRAPDLVDQAGGVPGTQRSIPQVLNRLAVPCDLGRAFLVPVTEETLDIYDRTLTRAFPEFKEIKIAVGAGVCASVPRDDL